ncbi:signal transduction histidine kinase [Kibdelosporangium banguiense]|uniref:Signal transduction histidine kinase n=1 Tax=Kibdelosporangium banguiense TaxID=1365924 RepID=A0ABS4TVH9_9PSEU|nr:signal transduction histidine kinase [Kibdelosporangium banguiense]
MRSIAQAHGSEVFAEPRPGGGAAIGFTLGH